MKRKSVHTTHFRSSQAIATISVALVLFILGIVALTAMAAHHVTDNLRSGIGIVAVIDTDADSTAVNTFTTTLRKAAYVEQITVTDADAVYERWQQMMGDDESTLLDGVNPFLPECNIKLRQQWTSADSLQAIADRIADMPQVWDVKTHSDIADNINTTIDSIITILLIIAVALLIVSAVLINNTIRLEIYGHRTIINTMQYVGATAWFIRRPYVVGGILCGIIAGLMASAVLAALFIYTERVSPAVTQTLSWPEMAALFATLTAVGALLCAVASLLSTNRYIRHNHDDIIN